MAVPALTPVTTPAVLTEATEPEPVLHEPPANDELTIDVAPVHRAEGPLKEPATGAALTVILVVATDIPQPALTV